MHSWTRRGWFATDGGQEAQFLSNCIGQNFALQSRRLTCRGQTPREAVAEPVADQIRK
jgi:hypothetical protein